MTASGDSRRADEDIRSDERPVDTARRLLDGLCAVAHRTVGADAAWLLVPHAGTAARSRRARDGEGDGGPDRLPRDVDGARVSAACVVGHGRSDTCSLPKGASDWVQELAWLAVAQQETVTVDSDGTTTSGQTAGAALLAGTWSVTSEGAATADARPLVLVVIGASPASLDRSGLASLRRVADVVMIATELLRQVGTREQQLAAEAHDLRQPLTVAIGAAETVADRAIARLKPEELELLERGARSGRRLEQRLDRLVTDISGRRRATTPVRFLLDEVIDDVLAVWQPHARRKGIDLRGPHLSPITVSGDPERLARVLGNLLSNAIAYTPPGGDHEVDVEVEVIQPDAVLIRVRDTGLGLDPEQLPVLTQPFTTGLVRPTAGERSTGLGLATVASIVEDSGGSLTVDGEPGVGTQVSVVLRALDVSATRRDGDRADGDG